jgi:hypothetical protein|tara:strand:+ start:1161 stop:1400 length:240 start_codon:yes stop_codon:yes gene_type:complete
MIPKILQSSVNPEKISLTLKGLIPLVLVVSTAYGWNLDEGILNEWVASVVTTFTALVTLFGATRKIINTTKEKKDETEL